MGVYVQASPGSPRQTAGGEIEDRTGAGDPTGPVAAAGGSRISQLLNHRPQIQSLLQLSQKLNQAPAVQAQFALQRVLNRPPGAGPNKPAPIQRGSNAAGLSDPHKADVGQLPDLSLDDARVRYNLAQPAQLSPLACAQGGANLVAPGQETDLSHDARSIVQQPQGSETSAEDAQTKAALAQSSQNGEQPEPIQLKLQPPRIQAAVIQAALSDDESQGADEEKYQGDDEEKIKRQRNAHRSQ